MKKLLLFVIGTMLTFAAYGQSNLPLCRESEATKWANCVGTFTDANGDMYAGEFKDGKFHGQGSLKFSNGESYVGQFKLGNAQGIGLHIKKNNERYAGEFLDNNYHGKGIYLSADGKIISEGIWDNDKFIHSEKIDNRDIESLLVGDRFFDEFTANKLNADANVKIIDGFKLAPLNLYAHKEVAWLKSVKNIEGNSVLADPSALSGQRISVCLLVNEKNYQDQGVVYFRESVEATLRAYFSSLAPNLKPVKFEFFGSQPYDPKLEYQTEFSSKTDCWNWDRGMLAISKSSLVIARAEDHKYLIGTTVIPVAMPNPHNYDRFVMGYDYESKFDGSFQVLSQISGDSLQANNKAFAEINTQRANKKNERLTKFKQLAAQNSKEFVASLTLRYINKKEADTGLKICTIAHNGGSSGIDQFTIDSYSVLDLQPYSEAMRENMYRVKEKPLIDRDIKIFSDIDTFYKEYQREKLCHVVVDFPTQINSLMEAILRDTPNASVELNVIYESQKLRDKFTITSTQFKNYADYQFASSIGSSASDLSTLQLNGGGDAAGFDQLVDEMKKLGYANSRQVSDVVAYLADRKEGGGSQGALKVRDFRRQIQAKAAEEAADRMRKLNSMRAKKIFPLRIVCQGIEAVSSVQITTVVNLYSDNIPVEGIANFIKNSTCSLGKVSYLGEQLTEFGRRGKFVAVRHFSSTNEISLFGMVHADDWDVR